MVHSGREGKSHSVHRIEDLTIGSFTKANTLLADRLFSPSLLLAERIERGLVPATGCSGLVSKSAIEYGTHLFIYFILLLFFHKVVELGAGCALPSLLMATLAEHPSVILVTDHPDKTIF